MSNSSNEPGDINNDWPEYWRKQRPGWLLNKDTDVDRLYRGVFNLDAIREVLGQDRFKHLTERPVSNFTIERIGDFIYQHNQGTPDSLLEWTWQLKNRVIWEFQKRLSYAQQFSFQTKPYYGLDAYDIITIHDRLMDIIDERFRIDTINIPLNGNYMNITAQREFRPNVGIPSFDQSHKFRWGPYWYGIDTLADNNVDYRISALSGRQTTWSDDRSNVGQGTIVPGATMFGNSSGIPLRRLPSSTAPWSTMSTITQPGHQDAPNSHPENTVQHWQNNWAHFYTQRFPLIGRFGPMWGLEFDENRNENWYYMPGNPGKVPGYTLADIQRHRGHASYKEWFPHPRFGDSGSDWFTGVRYRLGAVVRVIAIRRWSTIISYVFFRCVREHTSDLSRRPRWYAEPDLAETNETDIDWRNYWIQITDPSDIQWTVGNPVGSTHDFYDLAFFEGEMSLEVGYAATPIRNGEIDFSFITAYGPNGELNRDLMRPHRYILRNGRWIFANSMETGFARNRMQYLMNESGSWNSGRLGAVGLNEEKNSINETYEAISPMDSLTQALIKHDECQTHLSVNTLFNDEIPKLSPELNNFLIKAFDNEGAESNLIEPIISSGNFIATLV